MWEKHCPAPPILMGLSPYSTTPLLCCRPSPLFPTRDRRPFEALCKPSHSEVWGHAWMVPMEGTGVVVAGAGLVGRWQAELLLYPSFADTVFPETSWEKKEKTPIRESAAVLSYSQKV